MFSDWKIEVGKIELLDFNILDTWTIFDPVSAKIVCSIALNTKSSMQPLEASACHVNIYTKKYIEDTAIGKQQYLPYYKLQN